MLSLSFSHSAITHGNKEDFGESSSFLFCPEGMKLLLPGEVSHVEHLGSICDLTAFAIICQRLQPKCLHGPSRSCECQFSSLDFQKVCWCGWSRILPPLTCISVWLVLSRDQLGLWGGGVHLVRPGSRKSIFLEKGRLRERSGFPQATERPQFLLKPYRALHRFPTPPLSASGPVLWESGNSREATAGARRPVSSSVSLASSCQGRPRASPNRDGLKLGLALKH